MMTKALALLVLYVVISNIIALTLILLRNREITDDKDKEELRRNENMFIWLMSGVWPVSIAAIIMTLLKGVVRNENQE